jgi:hypothetical protein
MKRCVYCHRWIWLWQRQGWIVGFGRWHTRCYRMLWRLG